MKEKDKALPTTIQAAPLSEKKAKKPGKIFILITYLLALASLIAVLFVPLYNGKMLIQLVWAACENTLLFFKIKAPAFAYGDFFIAQRLSIYECAFILGIAVSTVLALIMLFPVIFCKNPQGAKLRCAFAAEQIAFLVVTANLMWEVLKYNGTWNNFAILIPFGVLLLVMAAQSIKFKGGLGVAKFIIFLLALLTAVTLLDITLFIPALKEPLKSIAGIIGAYDANVTFVGSMVSGVSNIRLLLRILIGKASFVDPANTVAFVYQILPMVLTIVVALSIFLDVIGLVAGNKTKKSGEPNPHKGWFVVAVIRYSLIILLIAAAVVLSFVLKGFGKVGIYMYCTAVLVILTFIVEIIRYCVGKAKVKAYKRMQKEAFNNEKIDIVDNALEEENTAEAVEINQESGDYQTNIFGEEPVAAQPAAEAVEEQPTETVGEQLSIMNSELAEEPVEEAITEAVPVEEVVEEVAAAPIAVMPVETAPVEEVAEEAAPAPIVTPFGEVADNEEKSIDPFIDKLTDEERAQFYDVFINRNMGKFSTIPAYEINGNNADFFPAVFVHINRMRNICSDSLLAKIYKEIGKD